MKKYIDTFQKIQTCSGVSTNRMRIQLFIIAVVAGFESLFIFFLIPFLELFNENSNDFSFVSVIVINIFSNLHIPFDLVSLAICLSIIICFRELSSALNQYASQKLIGSVERGIQNRVVDTTLSAKFLVMLNIGGGKFTELCSICSRETAKVAQALMQIFSIFVTIFSYFTVLIFVSPVIALIAFFLAMLATFILSYTVKKAQVSGQNVVLTREKLSQFFINIYEKLREIKVNNQSSHIKTSVAYQTQNLFLFTLQSVTTGILLRSLLTVVLIAGTLMLILYLKSTNLLDLAILTAGLAMVMRLLPLILNFTRIRQGFAAKYPYLEQLETYLLSCRQKKELDQGKTYFEGVREKLEFRNVVFTYPSVSRPALNGLNLTIKKGRSIALTGSSGAGKSTLIDLLPKLIHADHGNILIDGEEINSFSLESLRNGIAYLPQNPSLHDGSIRYNICFSDDPQDDDQIKRIISDVGLEELVKNLPDGLDTQLGSTALKLSGGQSQRLAIARALFKQADIFIFDEPTSALDAENADIVSSLIADLARKNKSTVLVISHNWETVSKLDYMVKLEDGRIAYHGKPDKKMMGLSVTNTNNQKD